MDLEHRNNPISRTSIFFFFFLFIALFLGDGKQPLVDIFGSAGIIGLALYAKHNGTHLGRNIRASERWVWTMLISWFVLRTLLSWDIGYSIYGLGRIIVAYITYSVFSSFSTQDAAPIFARLLLLFTFGAIIFSFVLMPFSHISSLLPVTNLLYANYGHNHLANLLVLGFPLVLYLLARNVSKKNILVFCVYVAGLLFSFSRGAMVLVGAFGIMFGVSSHNKLRGGRRVVVIALALLVYYLVSFGGIFYKEQAPYIQKGWIARQITKPLLFDRGRVEYWKQAFLATTQRPLGGFGPGTFFLLSRRFRTQDAIYSMFAHSFPLETLSEVGIVGALLFGAVLYFPFRRGFQLIRHKQNASTPAETTLILRALMMGAFLTGIYSFYEINLNFFVVWVLFWAILGIVRASEPGEFIDKQKRILFWICLGFLAIFYITTSVGTFLVSGMKKSNVALFVAPHEEEIVSTFLRERIEKADNIPEEPLALMLRFHGNNSEIIYKIGQLKERALDTPRAFDYYRFALQLEPRQLDFRRKFINFLLTKNRTEEIQKQIQEAGSLYLSLDLQNKLRAIDLSFVNPSGAARVVDFLGEAADGKIYLSKFLYAWGLFVEDRPKNKAEAWALARDISSQWGHFHVELASLQEYLLQDPSSARLTLSQCISIPLPSAQCQEVLKGVIPPVGSLQRYIRQIPNRFIPSQ